MCIKLRILSFLHINLGENPRQEDNNNNKLDMQMQIC